MCDQPYHLACRDPYYCERPPGPRVDWRTLSLWRALCAPANEHGGPRPESTEGGHGRALPSSMDDWAAMIADAYEPPWVIRPPRERRT